MSNAEIDAQFWYQISTITGRSRVG